MSPTETNDTRAFEVLMLDALVPLPIQHRVPAVRKIWSGILQTDDGRDCLAKLYEMYVGMDYSASHFVSFALADDNRHMRHLSGQIYTAMFQDHNLIEQVIGRRVTDGNEPCPYWTNFAYSKQVKKPI